MGSSPGRSHRGRGVYSDFSSSLPVGPLSCPLFLPPRPSAPAHLPDPPLRAQVASLVSGLVALPRPRPHPRGTPPVPRHRTSRIPSRCAASTAFCMALLVSCLCRDPGRFTQSVRPLTPPGPPGSSPGPPPQDDGRPPDPGGVSPAGPTPVLRHSRSRPVVGTGEGPPTLRPHPRVGVPVYTSTGDPGRGHRRVEGSRWFRTLGSCVVPVPTPLLAGIRRDGPGLLRTSVRRARTPALPPPTRGSVGGRSLGRPAQRGSEQ